jgi:outer membrane protein OmpA-like peptidoglycan-associated protein
MNLINLILGLRAKREARRRGAFLAALLFLLSCAEFSINALDRLSSEESMLKTKGGYDSYLALEYLQFARNLASIKDNSTSHYFAVKGLHIVEGKPFIPENPIKWRADIAQIEEMVLMQKRLEMVLTEPNLKFYLPIQLAHLSYLYDCWISRESKSVFTTDDLAQCRTRFSKLLDEVERYIDDFKRDTRAKIEVKEPEFERFEVLFDFDNAKINDKGMRDILKILKHLKTLNGDYRVLVVGNADRAGFELYNQSLALNRAEVVRDYLMKNGVYEKLIELRSYGEDFPDIVTKNGLQKQINRTVGVYVVKGYASFASFPLPLIENQVYRREIMRAREERGLEN